VDRWCTDIPPDSDGISSYVCHLKIRRIFRWAKPALFSHMLGTLSSLTKLSMYATEIPDELLGHISRGEFWKGITALHIWLPICRLATVISMILSLPDLKELSVQGQIVVMGEPVQAYPVAPQTRPLNSLKLLGDVNGIGKALAKSRFISSRLSLYIIANAEQLLMLSSETVVELKLRGVWFLWILRPSRDDSDRSSRLSN
jgi:hypothetical protein